MVFMETMGNEMHNIVEKGPQASMHQPMRNNTPVGYLKQKPKTSYDDDDKKLFSIDMKARATIGNSLPYYMYHLVQNCESAQEMMDTLAGL